MKGLVVGCWLVAFVAACAADDFDAKKARIDHGILDRVKNKREDAWYLKSDSGERYLLGLPTKNRKKGSKQDDPPEKDAPIDPAVLKVCNENIGKRVLVVSRAGFFGFGKTKALLVLNMFPATAKAK